jgi:hypothetical protein
MNDSADQDIPDDDASGFTSNDSVIIFHDGPGDTTVRPCSPERRAFLMAEHEKIQRWEAEMKERALAGEEVSLEPLIIESDGPGDTTVRPCSPERRAFLMAERERIERWQKWLREQQPSEGTKKDTVS